jgi:SAM-dependent methyltransferase
MAWPDLGDWWLSEVAGDPAYEEVVTPLLLDLLVPEPGALYVDLGCGEGRVMRRVVEVGARVVGVDVNESLAGIAGTAVVAELPDLPMAEESVDGCYAVLVLEHLVDEAPFFSEAARVSRRGGCLAVVMNHPVWTAVGSTPIGDVDGEVLWRPGDYFRRGASAVAAGEGEVVFHHRSLGALLTAAAGAGWSLERLVEQPHHDDDRLPGVPRLLGCRWRRLDLLDLDRGVV